MTGLPWTRARERALAAGAATSLAVQDVPLDQALGVVLSEPIVALTDLPPCETAAMDGFAVAGLGPWQVVRTVLAGQPAGPPLLAGQAVEVATGAPVPENADGVLPYEMAARQGDRLAGTLSGPRHIRPRGEDAKAGDVLVPTARQLTAVPLGLAAVAGHDTVRGRPPPRVAAVVTGDELLSAGTSALGHVRDAASPMLPGLLSDLGARLVGIRRVADRRDELRSALLDVSANTSLLVTVGAASRGPADHLRGALEDLEAELVVDGVAVRPGHPQLLARLPDARLVVGLPGNPYATLAAALTLLPPVIAGLTGSRPEALPLAVLEGDVRVDDTSTRLVPVEYATDTVVRPMGWDRPASLRGAALADALAVVPPHWGGRAQVQLLRLAGNG